MHLAGHFPTYVRHHTIHNNTRRPRIDNILVSRLSPRLHDDLRREILRRSYHCTQCRTFFNCSGRAYELGSAKRRGRLTHLCKAKIGNLDDWRRIACEEDVLTIPGQLHCSSYTLLFRNIPLASNPYVQLPVRAKGICSVRQM